MYFKSTPLTPLEEEEFAPLASEEDLSVLITPLSSPGSQRKRWSQLSNGSNSLLRKTLINNNQSDHHHQIPLESPKNYPRRYSRPRSSYGEGKVPYLGKPVPTPVVPNFKPYIKPVHEEKEEKELPVLSDVELRSIKPSSSSPSSSGIQKAIYTPRVFIPDSLHQQTGLEAGSCSEPVEFITPRSTLRSTLRSNKVYDSSYYTAVPIKTKDNEYDEHNNSFRNSAPINDRLNLIYLTLILHGIGTQMSWNMFITAKEQTQGDWYYMMSQYFVTYKLGEEFTNVDENAKYSSQFLQYVCFAAQVPNLIFNWVNIFLNIGNTSLTTRIVWTILIEVIIFVFTIIMAMVDTSNVPGVFFYLTMSSIVILNSANGIYQNTVYGIASKLPFKYTGAVVIGSNISGLIVATINIISIWLSPNPRTAAIYYFITALFILLACFDTYFALPLNRFFRYHDHQYNKAQQLRRKNTNYNTINNRNTTTTTTTTTNTTFTSNNTFRGLGPVAPVAAIANLRNSKLVSRLNVLGLPYWRIFKDCLPQCFNIFFTFFITLTIFPTLYSDVRRSYQDFFISETYFTAITCFLTYNIAAVLGNLLASYLTFPSPRWLFVPVLLRAFFIPFFAFCNYRPLGVERIWPVLFHWDSAYWIGGILFGFSGGYLSSVALMYCPRSVSPEFASTAGMFGAASIMTGIMAGIGMSYTMPLLISTPEFAFETPDWWPQFNHP